MGELIALATRQDVVALDKTARDAQAAILQARKDGSNFALALVMARAMEAIRRGLSDELMRDIMGLQNSPLGFLTDKRAEGYPVAIVRDCAIQAILHGARMTGNEWNIISEKCYLTVEFWKRQLYQTPGLTEFREQVGAPELVGERTARVPYAATWKLDGRPDSIKFVKTTEQDWRISVKVNRGMGDDAIQGKARARAYRRIVGQVQGQPIPEEEELDAPAGTVDGRVDATLPDADGDPLAAYRTKVAACSVQANIRRIYLQFIADHPGLAEAAAEVATQRELEIGKEN